jgi:hypothetical protein
MYSARQLLYSDHVSWDSYSEHETKACMQVVYFGNYPKEKK